jgi:hypothetical protein
MPAMAPIAASIAAATANADRVRRERPTRKGYHVAWHLESTVTAGTLARRMGSGAAIERAYGFAFPPDLLQLWEIAKKHRRGFDDARVRLVGPFALLRGAKLGVDLDRWPSDPPELFTVAEGDTDGLHWGYVFHEPGSAPGYVAQFYSRDGYPIEPAGPTLLHAMHAHVKATARDAGEELADIRNVGENDAELARSQARLDALEAALLAATEKNDAPKDRANSARPQTERVTSIDGLGVRAPAAAFVARALERGKLERDLRNAAQRDAWLARGHALLAEKKAGTALQIARDALAILPTKEQDGAVLLAVAAYEALGRPLLARTFAPRLKEIEKRSKSKTPAKIENRISHSMKDALLAPAQVERLILERWGAQSEAPDLDAIARLPRLDALILRGYKLGDLPASFAKLKSLRTIELFECALTTLPKVLAKLPRLERIDVIQDSGRRIPRVPLAIPRGIAFPKLTGLKLVACGLREVPAFVLSCKKLATLSLGGNRIATLPEGISALANVRYLNVGDNALTELPQSIAKMKSLSALWLDNNRIEALPDEIAKLPLKSLQIAGNPLVKNKAERARTKALVKKASIYWA